MQLEELAIKSGHLGLITNGAASDLSKESFRVFQNVEATSPGLLKNLLGAGVAQIRIQGTLTTVPALPSSFSLEKASIHRITQPADSDVVVIFGSKSGRDRVYVFPNIVAGAFVTNGGSYVSNSAISWMECTEAEAITVNVVTDTTHFTLTGLSNNTTNDYYNKWYIWDHTRFLYDYVLDYNSSTGVLTTKFGITSIANGDTVILMRFPVFKKASSVSPFYQIDDLPTFAQHGENLVIHTGAHDINDGPDLWLGFIGDGVNAQGYFDDDDLDYNGWHFDFEHSFRVVDGDISDAVSWTVTSGSTDPIPWTSGTDSYAPGMSLLYDSINESRVRIPQDAVSDVTGDFTSTVGSDGAANTRNITAADQQFSFRLDVDILDIVEKVAYKDERFMIRAGAGSYAADASSNTTTLIESILANFVDDELNGWIVRNSTRSASSVVSDSVGSTKTLTISPAIASQTTGDQFLLRPPAPSIWSRRIKKVRVYLAKYSSLGTVQDTAYFFAKEIDIDNPSWALTGREFRLSSTIVGSEYKAGQAYPFEAVNGYGSQDVGANAKFEAQVAGRSIIGPIFDDTKKLIRCLFSPIRLSGETAPDVFPVGNRIDTVSSGVPDITFITEQFGRLIIFGRHTTLVAELSGPNQGSILEQFQKVGLASYRTVKNIDGLLFFSSYDNILEVFDGNRMADPAPGFAIKDYWDGLTDAQKEAAFAGYHKSSKTYWIASGSQRIFVYNVRLNNWSEYDSANTYIDFFENELDGSLFGATASSILELMSDSPTESLAIVIKPQAFNTTRRNFKRVRLSYKSGVVLKFTPVDYEEGPVALGSKVPVLFLSQTAISEVDQEIAMDTAHGGFQLESVAATSPAIQIDSISLGSRPRRNR